MAGWTIQQAAFLVVFQGRPAERAGHGGQTTLIALKFAGLFDDLPKAAVITH